MTIDLGELADTGQPGVPQPMRARRGSRPLRPARAALAVLLVLTAVLLGPSDPQPVVGTEVVVPAGYNSLLVVGETLFATTGEPGGGPARNTPELAAFRLPDLTRLWQTTVPGFVYQAEQAEDVLLVGVDSGDEPEQQTCTVLALAVEDGRTLWCDAGFYDATTGGALLRHVFDGTRSTIAAVDPRTGVPRWSQPTPDGLPTYVRAADGRVATYLVSWPDGRLEMRDAHTGEQLASRTGFNHDARSSFVEGDLFLAYDGGLWAYGLADLEPRWSLPPEATSFLDWNSQPAGCDHKPCYFTGSAGVVALDPRTGAELWRDERWRNVRFAGDLLLLSEDWYWEAGASGARTVLAEADGTPIGSLERWRLLHAGLRPGEQVVAVRPVAGNRILVADLASGESPKPLGVLNDAINDCQWGSGFVSCRRLDGGRSLLVLPR